jgi:hypothetical protein
MSSTEWAPVGFLKKPLSRIFLLEKQKEIKNVLFIITST